MKVEDTEKTILIEGLLDATVNFEELEAGFEQLELLSEAMETGNFGVLIGKSASSKLTSRDIIKIKRVLRDIVDNNPVLSYNSIPAGRTGGQRISLLQRRISHGFSALAMASLTGLLGGKSIAVALGTGGLGTPLSIALGGAAALTGKATLKQAETIRALNATGNLLDIVDTYADIQKAGRRRGLLRKLGDWLMNKTPSEIERETKKRIEQATRKAERKMSKLTRRLPKEIEYYGNRGEKETMPIEDLFDV